MRYSRVWFCLFAICCATVLLAEDFHLICKTERLSVHFSTNRELPVTNTALDLFFADMETVSGMRPSLSDDIKKSKLVVATLGKDEEIDVWLKQQNVSTKEVAGKWEAFKIQLIEREKNPFLLVLGSDAHGTAYGLLELSRLIGVSPWYWWADVVPDVKDDLVIPIGYTVVQQPSVQYRGVFLNDEDWGLLPWSRSTFEPESTTSLGVRTYEKIFELLLRLRANILWPAMHSCSTPFFFIHGAKELADKYGIILGTSHCEPLLRNTNGEWKMVAKGEYNYPANKEEVNRFWSERLEEVNGYENIYTIGMRGVHDGKMQGVETLEEQTVVLSEVIAKQRELLSKYIGKVAADIPQVFMPYKEVLDVYNNGLVLPEDVALVWCDDNYGYITRLSDKKEQKRLGGAGVYYHMSYFGKPHDYLWLYSTQPALIYIEMKRAWDCNARKLWMLNVGDIKPGEYGMEFFLDLAWNINAITPMTIYKYLESRLAREFGTSVAVELTNVLNEYFRLASLRKPEHMGFNRTQEYKKSKLPGGATLVEDTHFNPFMFGDELQKRANEYAKIAEAVLTLENKIPKNRRDAYYEMIQYPVLASMSMNHKLLYAQKARLFAKYDLPAANEYAEKSLNAYYRIAELTMRYNELVSNGKWKGIMDMQPRKLPVFGSPDLPRNVEFDKEQPAVVWVENMDIPLQPGAKIELPAFVQNVEESFFITLFSKGKHTVVWEIEDKPEWLRVEEQNASAFYESKLVFSIDWNQYKGDTKLNLNLKVDGLLYPLYVCVSPIVDIVTAKTESNKQISWNASSFEKSGKNQIIQGLGHSMNAVSLPKGEELLYEIYTVSTGNVVLRTGLIPNFPVEGGDLRYQITIDNEQPQIVSYTTKSGTEEWKERVLRNQALKITKHTIDGPGRHTIRVKALDDYVVLDQFMLDFDVDRKFYRIPVK